MSHSGNILWFSTLVASLAACNAGTSEVGSEPADDGFGTEASQDDGEDNIDSIDRANPSGEENLGSAESDGPVGAEVEEPVTLDACVDRWWQDPVGSACACAGDTDCAATCSSLRVIRMTSNLEFQSGIVQVSQTDQTLTVMGEMSRGNFGFEDEQLHFEPEGGRAYSASVDCQASQLAVNNVLKVPASAWIEVALNEKFGTVEAAEVAEEGEE